MSGYGDKGTPTDQSAAEDKAKREAERLQRQKDKEARQAWKKTLGGAYQTAIGDAQDYFRLQGLDPADYMDDIRGSARRIRHGLTQGTEDLTTPFAGIGEDIYNNAETTARNAYSRQFNEFAPTGFEDTLLGDTSDDAILDQINAEQYGSAEQYLQNLLKRGVITQSGYDAGRKDLDNQSYRAHAALTDAGNAALGGERTKIGSIANKGREAAANFQLGTQFDPSSFNSQITDSIAAFMSGLGGDIRNRLTAPLYNTSGLAAVAGGAQGAQNTKFDPFALAGIYDDEEDDNPPAQQLSIF